MQRKTGTIRTATAETGTVRVRQHEGLVRREQWCKLMRGCVSRRQKRIKGVLYHSPKVPVVSGEQLQGTGVELM